MKPLTQAANARSKFFRGGWRPTRRRGPVLALDLTGGSLEIVQSVPRGEGGQITRWAVEEVDPSVRIDAEDGLGTGRVIAETLRRLSLAPGPVVLGISREQVLLRALSLPATSSVEEMAAMVHFQVSKDVPFPLEEAVIDFQIPAQSTAGPAADPGAAVESETRPSLVVLVAVVRKQVVQRYLEIAAAAGCQLAGLGLVPSAQARCVRACAEIELGETVGWVTLRGGEASLSVMRGGLLLFGRAGSVTSPVDPASPSGTTASLAVGFADAVEIELTRSLHSFEGVGGHAPLKALWVAGNTGFENQVMAGLSRRFGIPCRDSIRWPRWDSKPAKPARAVPLTALGLAMSVHDSAGMAYDFLNPKRLPVQRNWRRIKMVAAAAVAGLCLLGCLGVRAHFIRQRAAVRDSLQAQVTAAEKNRGLYREMRLKAKTVQDWKAEKREWLDHYAYLSTLLPPCPEVYITSLSTGSRGTLHLSIQARSGDVLAQLDKRLRSAGYDLKPLAVTPGSDKYGYPFQSSLELTLPDKLKVDLAKLQAPARPADDSSLNRGGGQRRTAATSSAPESPAPKAESASTPAAPAATPAQPLVVPAVVQPAVVVESSRRFAPVPARRRTRIRPATPEEPAMNPSERRLATVVGVLVLGLGGIIGIRGLVVKPLKDLDRQTLMLGDKLRLINDERRGCFTAEDYLKTVAQRTFAREPDMASAQAGKMLTDQIVRLGLSEAEFSRSPVGPRRLRGAQEIGWSVQGEGPLRKIIDLLYVLEQTPRVHRLEGLVISGGDRPGRVKARFRYLTLTIDGLADVTPLELPPKLTLQSPERGYYDAIVQRDLLRPYVPGSPAEASPATAEPPSRDARPEMLKVVSLSEWGGLPEVHICDLATSRVSRFRTGEALADGTIVGVDYESRPLPGKPDLLSYSRVILKIGTNYWAVEQGQTLAEKYQLKPEQTPTGLPKL